MKPTLKDKIFVGLQFTLFILFFFNKLKLDIAYLISIIGLSLMIIATVIISVSVAQLNNNLSVFPSPLESGKLVKKGLYKYIRHPIYTGIIIGAFGFALFSASGLRLIIASSLYVLFYFKSNYEEDLLCLKYADYKEYMYRTGRFFPKIKKLFSKN